MSDDVQFTDLRVIQRYSLAVRGTTASRVEPAPSKRAPVERAAAKHVTKA